MQAAIPAAKWPEIVLVHEKPVEGDPQVAVATLDLGCRLVETKKASEMIDQSKRLLAVARTATGTTVSAATASQAAGSAKHPAERWRGGKVERPAAAVATQASDGKGRASSEERSGSGTAER